MFTSRMIRAAKPAPCTCGAYRFPHRQYSGSCAGDLEREMSRDEMDRDELRSFDRAEARAINRDNR